MTGCDSRTASFIHRILRGAQLLFLSAATTLAAADVPTLEHIFPVAAAVGTSNTITFTGKFQPWPTKVWVDAPGIAFEPQKDKGKFSVTVSTNAPIGPHLIRVYNDEGASAPRFLLVTRDREESEQEPNDAFDKPQVLPVLPTVVNGRLDKSGDIDSFAVPLEAGQEVIAWIESYTLGSTVDGTLRLVDAAGTQVAFNHDGVTLDPLLIWKANRKATYTLQFFGFVYPAGSEIKLTGGEGCVYRLHISTGPIVRYTLPLAAQRNARTRLELHGANLERSAIAKTIDFDATALAPDVTSKVLRIGGEDSSYSMPVSSVAELMEIEPNNSVKEAMPLPVPAAVTGRIEQPGDEDFFSIEAKKQESYEISVQSAAFGLPLDAWVKVIDATGKELTRTDDADGSRDPRLTWTAPESGRFVVVVGDLTRKGGPEYWYRLQVTRAEPSLRATVDTSAFTVRAGRTNDIKIALKRLNGHSSKLRIQLSNPPQGVEAAPVDVDAKSNEAVLKMIASKEAPGWNGPVQILVRDLDKEVEQKARFSLVSTGENNGVPQGYTQLLIDSTDQLWLTVTLQPPAKESNEKPNAAKKE